MKKTLLLISALATLSLTMQGQELKKGYITWPESSELKTYVDAWNGGKGTIMIDGKAWEDEEFFTSRVKPRSRFQNTATQVYPERKAYDLTAKTGTDKRLAYWVCIGDNFRNNIRTNALPNGVFDQEAFGAWNYVDHYGNWNCPWGWTPGVFADVAHKNGVGVSGVAGIPNAAITSYPSWNTALTNIVKLDGETLGKFLYYHGQNGLGYNSEFSADGSLISKIRTLHEGLASYMESKDPTWEIMWYAGTADGGSISFDTGLSNNSQLFKSASMFLNYNWNNTSYMTSAISKAKEMGRDPFRIYAGMNMQGGEPKSGSNYTLVKDYQYGIGLWAGHETNIIWKTRQNNGSDPMVKQRTYQHYNEMLFGNGKRNPAIKQTITDNRAHRPSEDFAGMSAMMNARSSIDMDIANESFITYFNLGNGMFYNWLGDRQNDNPWCNIGVQDYLPTWRWWFAPTWKSTNVTEGTTHLSADFTWEDAYMGGSCLKIEGTTTTEYLHLFKTKLTNISGKRIAVRFKLLEGEADVRLVLGSLKAGSEATVVMNNAQTKLVTVANSLELQDQSYKSGSDGWVVKQFNVPSNWPNMLENGIGLIGLEFKNAKNMKMLLGGLEITTVANRTTPSAPSITLAKTLAYNSSGVDAKLVWTMDGGAGRAAGTPVYNSDVKTSVFKYYSQQEGCEAVCMGSTTSWAAIVFRAPVNASKSGKMRFGVSAVSTDFRNESAIAWSDYLTLPDYETVADIVTDKPVIKPGEDFTMSFVDPKMSSGTWKLISAKTGATVYTGSGRSVTCPGLNDVGAYNLELTYTVNGSTVTNTYPSYIPITPEAVGALPRIYTLSIDGTNVSEESPDIEINTAAGAKQFGYTGRAADGVVSRGLSLDEYWFGVKASELGLEAAQSFSVAGWIRIDNLPEGRSNFVTVEDRIGGGWPYDNWGWFWSRINQDGKFIYDGVDTAWGARTSGRGTEDSRVYYRYNDAKIDVGAWTHFAICFEYASTTQFRMHLWLNGKKQKVSQWINIHKGTMEGLVGSNWSDLSQGFSSAGTGNYGTETYEPGYINKSSWPVTASMDISFGGSAPEISAIKGSLDDFQIWGKSMNESDVKASMEGLDANNLPAAVLGFWNFETEGNSDNTITGAAGANAKYKSPKGRRYTIESVNGKDTQSSIVPAYLSGCPFLSGSAYKIETKPTWTTRGSQEGAAGTGEQGNSEISFARASDYTVELTLANGHGSDSKVYPVIKVSDVTAIDGIEADEQGVATYTVDHMLFVDFAEEGDYRVMVFNTAGQMSAAKDINATAGQTAQISLRNTGIYLVKIVKDGRELRTVKVVCK